MFETLSKKSKYCDYYLFFLELKKDAQNTQNNQLTSLFNVFENRNHLKGINAENRVVEKTDVYSFAVTTLFLIFNHKISLELLYLPQTDENRHKCILKLAKNVPFLNMIVESLSYDTEDRPTLAKWRDFLRFLIYCPRRIKLIF